VTPLFFMGATAAAWASPWLGDPQAMAAGAGVAAVFGAAARAPLALVVMAAELMGVAVIPHALPVVLAARVVCGRQGLWEGQKEG
jgi:H+/Cl- antiporter ClcA